MAATVVAATEAEVRSGPYAAISRPHCSHATHLPVGKGREPTHEATKMAEDAGIVFKMFGKAAPFVLMAGLASCGTVAPDGSVATGPLGQQPLMTAEVQMATQAGIAACADAKAAGTSLSRLEAYGFVPWRGGYRANIDNPRIFAGDSSVSVQIDRRNDCRVRTSPIFPVEVQTLQSITASTLAGRGAGLDVWFVRSGDGYEVVLK